MSVTTTAIEIAASPSDVFPWLIEPDRLARWIGGFRAFGSDHRGTDTRRQSGLVTCSRRVDGGS